MVKKNQEEEEDRRKAKEGIVNIGWKKEYEWERRVNTLQ